MMTKGSFRPNRKTNTNIQSKIDEAKLNMDKMFGLLLIAFIQNLYTSTDSELLSGQTGRLIYECPFLQK